MKIMMPGIKRQVEGRIDSINFATALAFGEPPGQLRSRENASPSVELFWEKAGINVSVQETETFDCKVSR